VLAALAVAWQLVPWFACANWPGLRRLAAP